MIVLETCGAALNAMAHASSSMFKCLLAMARGLRVIQTSFWVSRLFRVQRGIIMKFILRDLVVVTFLKKASQPVQCTYSLKFKFK